MQNRVALGSPSLQRADHAASSVASTVSAPPGHPGDARLWWIPFESYPTNLSHTEPLIRWLLGRACHVGTCSAHHATVRALRPELKTADSTGITNNHHLRLQTSHVSRPFLVAGIPASSWPGLMKRPPPKPPTIPGKIQERFAGTREKNSRWSYGSCRAVMLRGSFADLPWALFFCSPNDSTHWKFSRSIWILEFQITALTGPWLHQGVGIARKLFNWATPHLCKALLLYGSQCLFN